MDHHIELEHAGRNAVAQWRAPSRQDAHHARQVRLVRESLWRLPQEDDAKRRGL